MDPDTILRELRTLMRELRRQAEGNSVSPDDADEAAGKFDALDAWLRRGGFLPRAWAKERNDGR